jgi:hypothetical protein
MTPNKINHVDEYDYNEERDMEYVWKYLRTTHNPTGGEYVIRIFGTHEDAILDIRSSTGVIEITLRNGKYYALELRSPRFNLEDLAAHMEFLQFVHELMYFMQHNIFWNIFEYKGLKQLKHPMDKH